MPIPNVTNAQQANDIRPFSRQGIVGDLASLNQQSQFRTLLNVYGSTAQVSTITVGAAQNSHEYIAVFNDNVSISYTSDSSATTDEIAAGLKTAIEEEPLAFGRVTVSVLTNVVTVTSRNSEVDFTLTTSDGDLTIATPTSGSGGTDIPFGRLVISNGYNSFADEKAALPAAAQLAAQVDTLTVTYAANEFYLITISVDGVSYNFDVLANTDSNTTATDIRAAINAAMPANTVIAAGSTNSVTLTAEVAGKAFTCSVGVRSATVSRLTIAHTTATINTDINKVAAGVSIRSLREEYASSGAVSTAYPPGAELQVGVGSCQVWVSNSQSPSRSDQVWVETAAGDNCGKFYTTTSSTRLLLSGARWVRDERSDNNQSIAVLAWN